MYKEQLEFNDIKSPPENKFQSNCVPLTRTKQLCLAAEVGMGRGQIWVGSDT